jgi:hypothetical protein
MVDPRLDGEGGYSSFKEIWIGARRCRAREFALPVRHPFRLPVGPLWPGALHPHVEGGLQQRRDAK